MKRNLNVLILIFTLFAITGCKTKKEERETIDLFKVDGTMTYYANELFEISETMDNLVLRNDELVLLDKNKPAVYQSKPIDFIEFEELVMTWNATINDNESATFKVILGNEEAFSKEFIMGYFQNSNLRSIRGQEDDFARVNVDTLINKDVEKNKKVIIKIDINNNLENEIVIKNVSLTTKKVDSVIETNYSKLIEKIIAVPPKQQLAIPRIGNLICSPTSLSMVIDYYGFNTDVVEVSQAVIDKGYNNIYGNWTLNASYAGTYQGITSRVEYINDFDTLVTYIEKDIPVVLSIKTTSKEQLDGSIMAYSSGHLLVLIGFELINDNWYALVNDPAEYEDDKVLRKYPIEQLMTVWRNYTYIISNQKL